FKDLLHVNRRRAKGADTARRRGLALEVFQPPTVGRSRREWLVEDLIIRGGPLVLGGPSKSRKTGLAIALGVSLASGQPFLNRFVVPRPVRVAIFSGESGQEVIQETAARIAESLGLQTVPEGLALCAKLPKLSDVAELYAMEAMLHQFKVEVAIIDPM